ncbi:MAG: discoidin domain-containing protein [Bacteroidales bacterium]|jgi:hypothetical protein|nr:discoidin domain-containing protein [Bacteroidales bacterium]
MLYQSFLKKASVAGGILMAFLSASCDDDDAVTSRRITAVRQLNAQASHGEVVVKWLNPRSAELSHIDVLYSDAAGNVQTAKVTEWVGDPTTGISEGEFRLDCSDSRRRFFSVTAYTLSGYKSPTDTVSALAPAITKADHLLSTVNVKSAIDGVRVTWTYEKSIEADILLSYTDGGVPQTRSIPAGESGEIWYSDLPATLTTYTVTTVYRRNQSPSSYSLSFNAMIVNTENVVEIPKTNPTWMVLSNSAGVFGERVPERLFDNNALTDWHSSASPPPKPHFVVIDTRRTFYIVRYEMYPRSDDANANSQNVHRIWVSEDNANWTDTGTQSFTPDYPAYKAARDAGQTLDWFKYDTEYLPARYIKVEMVSGGAYSMLGELSLFGILTN